MDTSGDARLPLILLEHMKALFTNGPRAIPPLPQLDRDTHLSYRCNTAPLV